MGDAYHPVMGVQCFDMRQFEIFYRAMREHRRIGEIPMDIDHHGGHTKYGPLPSRLHPRATNNNTACCPVCALARVSALVVGANH